MSAAGFVRTVRGLRIALFGVPRRKAPECEHRWAEEGRITRQSDDSTVGTLLMCKRCGERKTYWVARP